MEVFQSYFWLNILGASLLQYIFYISFGMRNEAFIIMCLKYPFIPHFFYPDPLFSLLVLSNTIKKKCSGIHAGRGEK